MTSKSNGSGKCLDTRDVRVERISYEELVGLTQEWQTLLDLASRDNIFLSPAWVTSWWDAWGRNQPGFEPYILVVRCGPGRVVGIAPLYLSVDKIRAPLSSRRLQFIGTNFRKQGVTRTEYVDFLVDPQYHREIVDALITYIADNCRFDEFVLSDIRLDCATFTHLPHVAETRGWRIRHADADQGVTISLDGSFKSFLANLGKNSRLRLYNRRTILESIADFRIAEYSADQLHTGFAELRRLFRTRWQIDIFTSAQLQFQSTLIERLPNVDSLKLTGLHLDGKCYSILYNIRFGGTEFNFLSGFSESLHPKLSLGMLHLGYSIEQAYTDGMRYFDLLLGRGRRSHYKKNFHGQDVNVETIQLIANPLLGLTYSGYDTIMNLLRKKGDR